MAKRSGSTEVGLVVSCAEAAAAIDTQMAKERNRGNSLSMIKCSVSQLQPVNYNQFGGQIKGKF